MKRLDKVVAMPAPTMPSAGEAQLAEHQRPVGEGVEGDRGDRHRQRPARPLQRGGEAAQHDEAERGQHAPLQRADIALRLLGQRRVLPEQPEDRRRLPENQPDGGGDDRGRPQALAHRAPDLAHGVSVGAELARQHGRRRQGQADAEDEEQEIEVGAQRARGERVLAEPAHHRDIRRLHRHLGEVGQDQRPGERGGRPELGRPGQAARGASSARFMQDPTS